MNTRFIILSILSLFANRTESAKVYKVNVKNDASLKDTALTNEYHVMEDEDSVSPHGDVFLHQLLAAIKQNHLEPYFIALIDRLRRCDRHFGKQKCIEDVKRNLKMRTKRELLRKKGFSLPGIILQSLIPFIIEKLWNGASFIFKKLGLSYIKDSGQYYGDRGAVESAKLNPIWYKDELSDGYGGPKDRVSMMHVVGSTGKKRPLCALTRRGDYRKSGRWNSKQLSSTEYDTSEEEPKEKKKKRPKRFQVVPQSSEETFTPYTTPDPESKENISIEESSSPESESDTSGLLSSTEDVKPKKLSISGRNDKYNYMQGRNRLFGPNARKGGRLPYFMPKRYHWDESDLPNLGYYWFNGPRGRYSAPFRID